MEHTGIYISGLVNFLIAAKAYIWVEMPLRIKKSLGLQRGSDDKIAAVNIAQYAYRFRDQARLWKPVDTTLQELRNLLAQRDRLLLTIAQLSVPLNEMEACGNEANARQLRKLLNKAITGLQKSLQAVEKAIDDKISADAQISQNFELLERDLFKNNLVLLADIFCISYNSLSCIYREYYRK